MQGIVVKGLKDYVVATYDRPTWRTIQDRADVDHRLYAPVGQYPDRHGAELAAATRSLTGVDEEDLVFAVGRHLVPTLLQVYGVHVTEVDTGLDVLADAQSVVAQAIRRKELSDVEPLDVAGERLDEETVLVRYGGDHCAGLGGIAVGLGEHYDEEYSVTERSCRREGADRCEFVVQRSPESAGDTPAASDD